MSFKEPKGPTPSRPGRKRKPAQMPKEPASPRDVSDAIMQIERETSALMDQIVARIEMATRKMHDELEYREHQFMEVHLKMLTEQAASIASTSERQLAWEADRVEMREFAEHRLVKMVKQRRLANERGFQSVGEGLRGVREELMALVCAGSVVGLLAPTLVVGFLPAAPNDIATLAMSLGSAIAGGIIAALVGSRLQRTSMDEDRNASA